MQSMMPRPGRPRRESKQKTDWVVVAIVATALAIVVVFVLQNGDWIFGSRPHYGYRP